MDEKKLFEQVRNTLHGNLVTGYSKSFNTDYTFIRPSRKIYQFQFFWDTCFHLFILCAIGEGQLAKKCLKSLFAMQDDSGFVGHIHYWNNIFPSRITDIFQSRPSNGVKLFKSHMSALIQPPLVAEALKRIWQTTGDREYLTEMLPRLKKYFSWLAKSRDYDHDGLITIITPFESGMDWKASYDRVVNFPRKKADLRLFLKIISIDFKNFLYNYNNEKIRKNDHFRVKDTGFNTIYIQNLRALGELCEELDDPDAGIYFKRAEKAIKSMVQLMYDDEDAAFYDVYGKDNQKLRTLTPTLFFPLVIKGLSAKLGKKVMGRHFFNRKEFYTKFPIPSLAINEPAFSPAHSIYIWRGPTWIVNNWFMHKFFMDKGYYDEAGQLMEGVKNLIEESGFREYYNPFTGEGYGACDFTWAGLITDMIQMEKQIR